MASMADYTELAVRFARDRPSQITATVGLVTYATLRRKLTPGGIASGILVAFIHMLHPWPAFFWLLMIFFLCGTLVTRIGHVVKATLTQSSTGGGGGEGPRSSVQVFANSGWASILILAHAALLQSNPFISSNIPMFAGPRMPVLVEVLPIGIIAQYAAVAADTFSSELGILSREQPFLITAPWKTVPRGTNGGITVEGLIYGQVGSLLLTLAAVSTLYFMPPFVSLEFYPAFLLGALLTYGGLLGSVIDSLLGATLQATVSDKTSGKVVEGSGGQRVRIIEGGSRVQRGHDILTNNGVNLAMAVTTSILIMCLSWLFGIRLVFRA